MLEHYKKGQVLPKGMERVRGIAMNGGYAFIEVYTDCYRAVMKMAWWLLFRINVDVIYKKEFI